MRYSELLKEVRDISGKMLSRELKDLETNELIERNVLNTTPVAVEYRITDYGKTLKQLTGTIADWGLIHRQRIIVGMKRDKEELNREKI
jgi:DNA-binding HxlR family transcriptional regulator